MENDKTKQYYKVKKCYDCVGTPDDEGCKMYLFNKDISKCYWSGIIDNDLEKIVKGDDCLTFPDLKELVRGIKYDK